MSSFQMFANLLLSEAAKAAKEKKRWKTGKKFLLVSQQRHRGDSEFYIVVGEFPNIKEAIAAISRRIQEFIPAQNGGGTFFFRLERGEYLLQGEKFFVQLEKLRLYQNLKLPKKLRDTLEPY